MDDVIVVGGRCAGAPTTMLLAGAGFKGADHRARYRYTALRAQGDDITGGARLPAASHAAPGTPERSARSMG